MGNGPPHHLARLDWGREILLMCIQRSHLSAIFVGVALVICALGLGHLGHAAPRPPAADGADTSNAEPPPEVTVIGKMDKRTLNHVVSQFIESHAKPSPVIGQIGRWTKEVCPSVTGLQDAYSLFVSRSITSVARSIGAPVPTTARKCTANVEVIFTPEPRAFLDTIAKKYRSLLGYQPKAAAGQVTNFSHPVQSWYMTGSTSQLDGYQGPHCIASPAAPCGAVSPEYSADMPPFFTGLQIDTDSSARGPIGTSGSYLTHDMRSEFVHVLIIVDSKAAAKYSLHTVSDYIALLALTHIASLDTCSELPSILNLFAKDCASPPSAMTASDTAYLKALYGANLDKNLNIEQGDIRAHMVDAISK
jgi:hypothetical protein